MLPEVAQMFALVRDLAAGRHVTEIALDPVTVQRHQLGPLAARAGMTAFRDDLVRSTIAWARIAAALPAVVDALWTAGVRATPIKGVSYATALYTIPAERPMTDIDLMVPPTAYAQARRVLTALGFRNDIRAPLHHASVWVRGDVIIDLHRGIIGAGRAHVDLDAVWERAREGWPQGACRFDPADELVFHLVHMARSRLCGPLIQVVDTARMLSRDNTISAVALGRARAWGLGRAASVALRFCRDVLDNRPRAGGWLGPSDDDVLAARQPSGPRKLAFDVAIAGSASQLAARVLGYIAIRIPSRSS
jgi:hypothetical protein